MNGVDSVSYSPDGRRIASGSLDRTVRVWDTQSGAELAILREHGDYVNSVSYSPDGRRIAARSGDLSLCEFRDNTVRVWDAQSGECLEVVQGSGDVHAIAAGPPQFPFRALARGLETVVERADNGQPLGCFPVSLGHIVTHPCGHAWAGASGNHLYIITLEGGPDLPAERKRDE
jgi:WD40 repeat protein